MAARVTLREVRRHPFRINPVEKDVGRDMFGYRVMRPLSTYLTWLFLAARVSANQVTVLQMAVGVAGAAAVAWGDLWFQVAGLILVYLGFLLDNCDGEIARLTGEVSVTGQYLDTFCHHTVSTCLFTVPGVVAWRYSGRVETLLLGFMAGLAAQRVDLSLALAQALKAIRKPLDQQYSYYRRDLPAGPTDLVDDLQGQSKKSEAAIRRLVYGVFSYPGVMHVLLFTVCLDRLTTWVLPTARGVAWVSLSLGYGVLLPLRRAVTLRSIVRSRLADRLFLDGSSERGTP